MARQIIKRRIGADGVDIGCEADDERYVDLKETKKTTYRQGRGEHFRQTTYTHNEHSAQRVYEDDPLHIEISEDAAQAIDYQRGVIKYYWLQSARGAHYQKTRVAYNNTATNEMRKVRTQRVTATDDPSQYVDVERIERFSLQQRRGALYRVKHVHLTNTEDEIAAMEGPCKST